MKKLAIIALLALTFSTLPLWAQVGTVGKTTTLALPVGSTEYSLDLGHGVKAFLVKARGSNDIRLAFEANGTTSSYVTIPSGKLYVSPPINSKVTLYIRCEVPAEVAEIEYWK